MHHAKSQHDDKSPSPPEVPKVFRNTFCLGLFVWTVKTKILHRGNSPVLRVPKVFRMSNYCQIHFWPELYASLTKLVANSCTYVMSGTHVQEFLSGVVHNHTGGLSDVRV